MKFAILHLSDIHIEDHTDWISDKGQKIAQAVLGTWEKLETVFIIISGDIANKGLDNQYIIANNFLKSIENYIKQQSKKTEIYFIVAPGNHDCNLSGDLKARHAFIDSVLSNPQNIEKDDSLYKGCLSVQDAFFSFAHNLETKLIYPATPQIFYQFRHIKMGKKFYFNIFNTSWLSKLKEEQGKLVFPTQLIELESEEISKCNISISIFHHPDNWLDSANAFEFKKITEQNSDIILSGHEHKREVFHKKDDYDKVETQIIRASALQERTNPQSSSFNLIIVDLIIKKQKLFNFKWSKNEYKNIQEGDWQDFIRNRFLQQQSFFLLPDFEDWLNRLDSLLSHSRKRTVLLDDFFIAPRLYVTSLKNVIDGKNANKKVEAGNFFKFLFEKKKLLIFGETWQGKTTVAKKVFKNLLERQLATIFVDGSKFENASIEDFKKTLKSEFSRQFNPELFERFLQLPKEQRAIVIDNFGQSTLNQKSLQDLLQIASEFFDRVVVFAHSNLSIQQGLQNEEKKVLFSDYAHCKMLPLNPTQVTQLIRRWIKFESNITIENRQLIQQENQLRKTIQAAVNNGLIQSTPFFIFGILQLMDSYKSNPSTQFGSVGYIYESIITKRLSDLGKTPKQVNQIFLIVSMISFWLYENEINEISREDIELLIKQYNRDYRENVYLPQIVSDFEKSQILISLRNNCWKFAGMHLRDFFIAKYYANSLGSDDDDEIIKRENEIKEMIETLIYEPHSRILLFLVYEAKSNQKLIRWILNQAKLIYSSSDIANFDSDVQFLNNLEHEIFNGNFLESSNPEKNLDKLDSIISEDEEDAVGTALTTNASNRLVKYSDELDEFHKVSISLKMIELVGQLVKNFSGTIKAQLKQELIEESIKIGLRLLGSIYSINKENIVELSLILKHLIKAQHPDLSNLQLEQRTDEVLIIVHHGLAYGIIKKISISVGHEDLKESFADIFQQNSLLSYRLVEVAIRLDHYNNPYTEKLIKFGKEIEKNKFAHNILKRLIADYVNYFEFKGPERQKLVGNFSLDGGKTYLLTGKADRDIHLT